MMVGCSQFTGEDREGGEGEEGEEEPLRCRGALGCSKWRGEEGGELNA